MYRKIILGIFVAVGMQVSSLGMEKEKTEILVSYNKNFVTTALLNGKLVVTPSDDNKPFSVMFEDNLFTIGESSVNFTQPNLTSPIPLLLVVDENITSLMTSCDLIYQNPFKSDNSLHLFMPNNGFIIASESHSYKNSVFGFGVNGGVHLLPKDLTAEEIKNTNLVPVLTNNNIIDSISYFISPFYKGAHSSNPCINHKFDRKPTCQVKDILVTLSPSIKENQNNFQNGLAGGFVEGTTEYGNLFKSNLSFTNTQLEIQANEGFYFNILDN